ncbi:MAG: hypothetical protein J6K40_03095 [Alistipes sp.]|nr:hypothetical protein [Alistipes sp.]
MTHLKHIALTLVAMLASLVADAATESLYIEMPVAKSSPVEEAQFVESHSMPLISPSTGSAQSILPAVRTIHRVPRHSERNELSFSALVRSIDSTTAAYRYGLYNHKILFFAYPRHYYLMLLVRLII